MPCTHFHGNCQQSVRCVEIVCRVGIKKNFQDVLKYLLFDHLKLGIKEMVSNYSPPHYI